MTISSPTNEISKGTKINLLRVCDQVLSSVNHLHKDEAVFNEQFYSRKISKHLVHDNEEKSTNSENKTPIDQLTFLVIVF